MIKFGDIINILGDEKQIQVYSEGGMAETKPKESWMSDTNISEKRVIKIKDRPTDLYTYVEIA